MARCKSSPEAVRAKSELASRLKEIRTERFGERGGPELARRLGLPIRTWYNYETGVTVPSEVLLRFIELTEVEPRWLLHGDGPRYRRGQPPTSPLPEGAAGTIPSLLRHALALLERGQQGEPAEVLIPPDLDPDGRHDTVLVHIENADGGAEGEPSTLPLKREWLAGARRCRCIRVRDDAMSPALRRGAVVGFAERADDAEALNGSLVVTTLDGQLAVRRLQIAGRVALLRTENPAFEPDIAPLDPPKNAVEVPTFRRVLWVYTPH